MKQTFKVITLKVLKKAGLSQVGRKVSVKNLLATPCIDVMQADNLPSQLQNIKNSPLWFRRAQGSHSVPLLTGSGDDCL